MWIRNNNNNNSKNRTSVVVVVGWFFGMFVSSQMIMMWMITNGLLVMVNGFGGYSPVTRRSWSSSSSSNYRRYMADTPFDASLYDDMDNNPFGLSTDDDDEEDRSLAVPPDTQLVLGLNKYSHDTTICAADAKTGKVLFAMAKERLSRKKHDGGNVATLVDTCLEQLELDLDNVVKVVVNNHHHSVLRLVESNVDHMEWEEGLGINGGTEVGYTDDENLFPDIVDKVEMSHHLAHAYSAAAQCPFDRGMVVVMDGMGETYRTMRSAITKNNNPNYVSDLQFEGDFICIPSDMDNKQQQSIFDWREGESVYTFERNNETKELSVKPVWKRFVEEKTPPTLYNHGFENMDSVGALYSRASSHIFGDWNACGKVMGLAPWFGHKWDSKTDGEKITAQALSKPILSGKLYEEDGGKNSLQIDRSAMMKIPHIARNDPDLFDEEGQMIRKRRYDFDDNDTQDIYEEVPTEDGTSTVQTKVVEKQFPTKVALDAISLSARMQQDLETVVMDFVQHAKELTGETNLCLAGGVALNSVLNGRLSRELGFQNVFIPPYPGDDGIAVGCCAYGLYGNSAVPSNVDKKNDPKNNNDDDDDDTNDKPPFWSEPLSPYLGPNPILNDMYMAIESAKDWLDVEMVSNPQDRYDQMAEEIASGGVIAWYHGRSELGPRALGHRSILADPRKKQLVRFINGSVKGRESFRPFAPSVLAEESNDWFDLGDDEILDDVSNMSPYMSMTAMVHEDKRKLIPAVTHVDGSSRLQTVTKEAEPLYHQLISTFYKLTGVPMVLNTSFNTLPSEPIVESPKDAILSFLSSMGSIEMLVMGDFIIKRKDANIRKLLGEESKDGLMIKPSFPKRAGPVEFETKFTIGNSDDDDEEIKTTTRIRMPNRPMHTNKKDDGWFEIMDDLEGEILGICDGTVGVSEIVTQYMQTSMDDDDDDNNTNAMEFQELVFGNIMRRLVRLYEYTFIKW